MALAARRGQDHGRLPRESTAETATVQNALETLPRLTVRKRTERRGKEEEEEEEVREI